MVTPRLLAAYVAVLLVLGAAVALTGCNPPEYPENRAGAATAAP